MPNPKFVANKFIVKILLLVALVLTQFGSFAQSSAPKKWNFGAEQDLLPYITGGYFACVWAGKSKVRVRVLTARVHKPDFMVKSGFTNNRVTAYAALVDYFLKEEWKGWWAGTGIVYWKSTIQAYTKQSTAHLTSWLLNGSIGYNFKITNCFYVSPWCALHLRVAGDRHVIVDQRVYDPPLLNPEASVKLGIYF